MAKTKEMSSIWADRVHMRDGLDSITVHRLGCRDADTIGLNDPIWYTKSNMGFLLHYKCEMLGKTLKYDLCTFSIFGSGVITLTIWDCMLPLK